ncbi:MAG: hypothetical protein JW902_02870 [Syntrophaceae bacterium]|nr:hypothetical protein [Syntrophaceae bacterium]
MRPLDEIPTEKTVLNELKDFQRKTVEYIYRRLYGSSGPVKRFLIADEVGLGKTLVAKGIIAKAVQYLKKTTKRIDIIYICSNQSIAKQNINRISLIDLDDSDIPRRLTLLPVHVKNLNSRKLNFVSFTPGTSFDLRSSGGIGRERALIYNILKRGWRFGDSAGPKNLFQCTMNTDNWRWLIKNYPKSSVDAEIRKAYLNKLGNIGIKRRFTRLVKQFSRTRKYSNIPNSLQGERYQLIGELRSALAEVCIGALEPDIVILDEFQRFRNLLDADDEMGKLARMVFNYPGAKVIMLSATPYKMYTMHHEKDREDHYKDFLRTVGFLFGSKKKLEGFKEDLERFRNALLSPLLANTDELTTVKHRIESKLRKVMVRTERLSATTDLSGMVADSQLGSAKLSPHDLTGFAVLDRVAKLVEAGDVIEYWKSAPYLLNIMDHRGYQLKTKLVRHGKRSVAPELAGAFVGQDSANLSWDSVCKFWAIEPANPKLRSLIENKVVNGGWKLLWIPPSIPCYHPKKGPYADPSLWEYTKSLVFSSWIVVPKAIAMLTSYEAERRMVLAYDKDADYQKERSRPRLLQFTRSKDRLTGMNVFPLVYPCLTLAAKIDPLEIASSLMSGSNLPNVDQVMRIVESRVAELLGPIVQRLETTSGRVDERWYWAALAALDWRYYRNPASEWLNSTDSKFSWLSMVRGGDDTTTGFEDHVTTFKEAFSHRMELGRIPANLFKVIAKVAVASPAVVAIRSFVRQMKRRRMLGSGPWLLSSSAKVAMGFRSLFNLPETTTLVRSLQSSDESHYWESALDYCIEGNLQAVMDEYVHVLKEYLGVASVRPEMAIPEIAQEITDAVSLRTVNLDFDEIIPEKVTDKLLFNRHSLRCRFALRFGDGKNEEEKTEIRKDQVRCAFNSPFRPFVLATTSIGQEGLDFHQYCHEIYHWNLPTNPVDLEQREGRIDRYKGHVIRRNIARAYGLADLKEILEEYSDPWQKLFEMALSSRPEAINDLVPYWIFEPENGLKISRFIPMLPLSRDTELLKNLRGSLAAYRMVLGQPRQEDLVNFLRLRFEKRFDFNEFLKFRIDLSPR